MRSGTPTAARPRKRAPERKAGRPAKRVEGQTNRSRCPTSSRRSFARPVERPPAGEGWGHEIKFDGYRMQLRVEDGEVALKTRKGLDWTDKFAAIAKEARSLPDVLIDGEIVALDHNGVPDFSALQAALSDGKTDELIFFAFDLLFAEDEDLRRCRCASARRG